MSTYIIHLWAYNFACKLFEWLLVIQCSCIPYYTKFWETILIQWSCNPSVCKEYCSKIHNAYKMEIHCSFPVADGTFQQTFSTIKNYAWAKMWQHTSMDKHMHFMSHDIIIWLLHTQTFKNVCPKEHCIRLEKISTLFAVIAHYLTFVLQTALSSHAGRKLSLAAWRGKLEKFPFLNIVYTSLFSVHLLENQRSELDTAHALPPTSLDNSCINNFQNIYQSFWKQHVLRGS